MNDWGVEGGGLLLEKMTCGLMFFALKGVWNRSMSRGHAGVIHPRRLRSIRPMIILELRVGVTNSSTFLLFWFSLRLIQRVALPEIGILLPSGYLRHGSCHSESLSTFQPLLRATDSSIILNLDPVSRVTFSWELGL